MRTWLAGIAFFLGFSWAQGQEKGIPALTPPATTLWDAAYYQDEKGRDQKIGFLRTSIAPKGPDTTSTRELSLTLRRGAAQIPLTVRHTTVEQNGKLVRMEFADDTSKLQKTLERIDKATWLATTKRPGDTSTAEITNKADLAGIATEMALPAADLAVGRKFDYLYFEPSLNVIVKVKGEAKKIDKMQVAPGQVEEWLRVEMTADKIQGIEPPGSVVWIDLKTKAIRQTEMELPGIGLVTLLRTTEAFAKSPNGELPDIMKTSSLYLPVRIPNIHSLDEMKYRLTFRRSVVPDEMLTPNPLQQKAQGKDETKFDLSVKSLRAPSRPNPKAVADKEFTESNYYLDSSDPKVQQLAKAFAGNQTDPWTKAQALERNLKANFTFTNVKPMDTAKQVANDPQGLRGDCTEVAMLLAAMCRAQGVPSRTAIGMIYVDSAEPHFAFHMWTEVFIDGEWIGLDATLGRGSVGPGHIKVVDASWHNERSHTPMLPVMGFMAKRPKIEVLK